MKNKVYECREIEKVEKLNEVAYYEIEIQLRKMICIYFIIKYTRLCQHIASFDTFIFPASNAWLAKQ